MLRIPDLSGLRFSTPLPMLNPRSRIRFVRKGGKREKHRRRKGEKTRKGREREKARPPSPNSSPSFPLPTILLSSLISLLCSPGQEEYLPGSLILGQHRTTNSPTPRRWPLTRLLRPLWDVGVQTGLGRPSEGFYLVQARLTWQFEATLSLQPRGETMDGASKRHEFGQFLVPLILTWPVVDMEAKVREPKCIECLVLQHSPESLSNLGNLPTPRASMPYILCLSHRYGDIVDLESRCPVVAG